MASYKEIQDYVREKHGYSAQTCWIAHVKEDMGYKLRKAPNRYDPTVRVKPCPPSKYVHISEAIIALGR